MGFEEWHVFAGASLSAFFDPCKYNGSSRDIIFNASVVLAVATAPPFARPVVLVIESDIPDVEEFLTREGAYWIRYAQQVDAKEIAENIGVGVGRFKQMQTGQRKPINVSESEVARGIKANSRIELERFQEQFDMSSDRVERFAKITHRLLHEVALSRIRPKYHGKLDAEAEHMSRTSSVDLLLHAREPNQPLLAIEFDGPHHRRPEQQKKDRAKERVLAAYGVPLIRITPEDADFWNRSNMSGVGRMKRELFFRLLADVIAHVGWQRQFEAGFTLDDDQAKKKLHAFEDQAARGMYGKNYVDLIEPERHEVFVALATSYQQADPDLVWQEHNFIRDQALSDAAYRTEWPSELVRHAMPPVMIGDLQIGWSAATDFKGRTRIPVRTATIRLLGAAKLDAELLERGISGCLIEAAAEIVRVHVRMDTPPKGGPSSGA